MDGKIVYTARKGDMYAEYQAELQKLRYHVVNEKSRELIEAYDEKAEAVDYARMHAAVTGETTYVVDSREGEPERKRSWLGRLFSGEGA